MKHNFVDRIAAIAAHATLVSATACGSTHVGAQPVSLTSPMHPLAPGPGWRLQRSPAPMDCIADITEHALQRVNPTGEAGGLLRTEALDDVDGDQQPEHLVAIQSLCGATGNCSFGVYLSHRGCTQYAGEVEGRPTVLEAGQHGVRALRCWWRGGCAGMEGSWTTYVFDGSQYRSSATLQCECPANPAQEQCAQRPQGCPCAE